ncbi:antibiotic biosynthesis monooxygenase [Listeria monocytogenes]|uniref:Antibiotic biosynthesis monooxygenase n=1 Tax=Listeria monocytogenes TaxID=1639 RepID=A0AAN2WL16_LISMN|nr:putative quinol monooxygenase [Listeria monocytogenes]EAF4512978.1 antibiotic biosynthesis monooxygenase [Listeria monocytogenes serotype 1/2a]AKI53799.1 Putative monooxygenase YcnE [Listeria monocytogenes]EAA0235841.1 antibiotic biosynthesis monooxygenase [Listeria monocytogenes]EAC2200762.1 antibiotic biosynthesis monooxygenase [Listeria monocytogenes]EAC2228724.1 antibiotic biosynthesis monooxygenase [Listeria monocytogenes]
MLHIEAQITVKKEQTEAFLQAAKEVIAASRAEAGNHGYELVQSTENETVFYMLEKWADMAAIQQHNDSEHFKKFQKAAADFVAKELEISVLTPLAR